MKEYDLEIVKDLYEESLQIFDIKIVDVKPEFANNNNKQDCDDEVAHRYLESYEYVTQRNPYEDCYIGKIARKIKNEEKWIILDYEA